MLTRAGYRPAAIFGLWSTLVLARVVAATALEEGGWLVVLPTAAGFLFALYPALAESLFESSRGGWEIR